NRSFRAWQERLRVVMYQWEQTQRDEGALLRGAVQEEISKPQPDKDEVGEALNRALKYAKKAKGFASVFEKLQPHLTKTTAWLGENWHKLLSFVSLTT
ncbi:MAG: hypothetical protein AAFX80_22010, partial [Cyanobacteria bacterium J06639_18]